MIYEKDGVRLTNNNPVCNSLFVKQGWIPIEDKEEVNKNPAPDAETQQDKPATKNTTKTNK